jgi:hypothetical protein
MNKNITSITFEIIKMNFLKAQNKFIETYLNTEQTLTIAKESNFLNTVWEGQFENNCIYLFCQFEDDIYRIQVYSGDFIGGDISIKINNDYELIALLKQVGTIEESNQKEIRLKDKIFVDCLNITLNKNKRKESEKKNNNEESFESLFKQLEISTDYVQKFKENKINFSNLRLLNDNDLKDLFKEVGYRAILRDYINSN